MLTHPSPSWSVGSAGPQCVKNTGQPSDHVYESLLACRRRARHEFCITLLSSLNSGGAEVPAGGVRSRRPSCPAARLRRWRPGHSSCPHWPGSLHPSHRPAEPPPSSWAPTQAYSSCCTRWCIRTDTGCWWAAGPGCCSLQRTGQTLSFLRVKGHLLKGQHFFFLKIIFYVP